jgi:hypothetical protein
MTENAERSRLLRKRILETLSLIASAEAQRNYQARVPHVDVPSELFNQWDDCYAPFGVVFQRSFERGEQLALEQFDAVLNDVANNTPKVLPVLEEFIVSEKWQILADAARVALQRLEGHGS